MTTDNALIIMNINQKHTTTQFTTGILMDVVYIGTVLFPFFIFIRSIHIVVCFYCFILVSIYKNKNILVEKLTYYILTLCCGAFGVTLTLPNESDKKNSIKHHI